MPFLVCGSPDGDTFVELCKVAADNGASILEIGIPFSDPIMDGPVIARATEQVLARGQTIDDGLALMERAAAACGLPLVAMTYTNVAYRRGYETAAAQLADAGASGVILPDMSVEDSEPWREACTARDLATIFIAAQTSPPERLQALTQVTTGFVYAASLMGVTGVRDQLSVSAEGLVGRIKERTDLPVAVGIGVSTPEHAAEVAGYADGVIVGSALVRAIVESDDPIRAAGDLVRDLHSAL